MNWQTECEKNWSQLIMDLSGLIEISSKRNDEGKTSNAPFGKACRQALDYMMELGKREGFNVQDVDGYACVLSYGEGEESIGVLGHLDVVPEGDGWSKDPYRLTIENNVLYGRGVSDDKGPSIAGFYALKMIKDAQIKLKKKVMLIFGCDEESGMECMDYYAQHGEIPDMGFVPDASFPVVYGEKGVLHMKLKNNHVDTIIKEMHAGERPNTVIGEASAVIDASNGMKQELFDFYLASNHLSGSMSKEGDLIHISIKGTPAHAAMPYLGNNAALHILNFIGTAYQDTFAKTLYEMCKDWQGKPLGIDIEGAYMGFLTMNIGIVDIDKQACIIVDIRYPNDTDSEKIKQSFEQYLKENQIPLDVEIDHDSKPLFVDPQSELVQTLMDVYRTCSGDAFTPAQTMGGGTYARKLPNFVAFGSEFPNQKTDDVVIGGPHQSDEGMRIDEFKKAVHIYCEAILRLAGQEY